MINRITKLILSDIKLFIFIIVLLILLVVVCLVNNEYIWDMATNVVISIASGAVTAWLCYGRKSIFDDSSFEDSASQGRNNTKNQKKRK